MSTKSVNERLDALDKKFFAMNESIEAILGILKDKDGKLVESASSNKDALHIDPNDVQSGALGGKIKYDEHSFRDLYREFGFNVLWDDAKKHGDFLDKYDGKVSSKELQAADWWPENIYESKDMFCQIAECLEYFDIMKIAEHICFVNQNASKDGLIQTANVNGLDEKEIYEGLYDDVKRVCENLIKYGELATRDNTILFFQSGRIRLESIYYYNKSYPDESYPIMRLYWTDSFESANED